MILKLGLFLSFFFYSWAFVQHCPFDGGHLLVIQVTDAEGKPINKANARLREVENPQADSCVYNKGLLDKEFLPASEVVSGLYREEGIIDKYCADCTFLAPGFYAVKLNLTEHSCLLKKDNKSTYRKRQFEIEFTHDGQTQRLKVDSTDIHSLCLGNGKWSRIVPLELKVP
jgi:hypothetical protein